MFTDNDFADFGLNEERRFTKAEVESAIEMAVIAGSDRARSAAAYQQFAKAFEPQPGWDPFGGAFGGETISLQKRARSFFGLKRSLTEDEVHVVRNHFADSPSILSRFEKDQVAVRFENGRLAGFSLAA